MGQNIKGINIEIGGNTVGLSKALGNINKDINVTQKELREVDRLLKLDPKNTELLTQKQQLLSKATDETKTKLTALKDAKAKADADMANGTEINQEQYRKLQREIANAEIKIESLEKETKELGTTGKKSFEDVTNSAEKFGKKSEEVGKKMLVVTAGVTAIAGASVKSFNDVDVGYDNMIKKTGATGDKAKELESVYDGVLSNISTSFEDAGNAVGEINTRFGFTDEQLQTASEQFIKFAKINNTDVNTAVQKVARAMGDAGIEAKDYNQILDKLTKAGQDSGISMDVLTENLTKYGAPMRALGFDTSESIAIFSSWEKAGVNTEIAFSGMKKAISNWSAAGKDSKEEFKKTLEEIGKAPDIASATTQAIEVFGQKAGPDLADAIQGGRFEYESFLKSIENSDGITTDTFKEISRDNDKMKVAVQNAKVALSELGETIMSMLAPILEKIAAKIKKVSEKFAALSDSQKETIIKIGLVVAAIGPALTALGKMLGAVKLVSTAIAFLVTNPIALAIAAIGLLAAAIGLHIAKSKEDTEEMKKSKEAHEKLTKPIEDNIQAYKDLQKSTDDAMNKSLGEVKVTQSLWRELQTLADENGNVKESNKIRAEFIMGELNEAMGTEYKLIGDQIQGYKDLTKEMETYLAKKQGQAILDSKADLNAQNQSTYLQTSQESARLETEISDKKKELQGIEAQTMEQAKAKFSELQKAGLSENIDIKTIYNSFLSNDRMYTQILSQISKSKQALIDNNAKLDTQFAEMQKYKDLSTAVYTGNANEILNEVSQFNIDIKSKANASIDTIKQQYAETSLAYLNLLAKYKKGNKGISDEQLRAAQELQKIAETEYLKAGGAIPENIAKGIDSKTGEITEATGKVKQRLLSWGEEVDTSLSDLFVGFGSRLTDLNQSFSSVSEALAAGQGPINYTNSSNSKSVTINQSFNSPKALTPFETSRLNKNATSIALMGVR